MNKTIMNATLKTTTYDGIVHFWEAEGSESRPASDNKDRSVKPSSMSDEFPLDLPEDGE